jgi:glycosyltransferase involved in cell wall biosynthesis
MKSVLIVTGDFPYPIRGGNMRVYKLTKYLLKIGVDVHIFCPASLTKRLLDDRSVAGAHFHFKEEVLDPSGLNRAGKIRPLFQFFKDRIRRLLPFAGGIQFLNVSNMLKILTIIEKNDIGNILTTSPPHSTHLTGYISKWRFPEINWIADFRDLWTIGPDGVGRAAVILWIDRRLELLFLESSNFNIFVSNSIMEATIKEFRLSNIKKCMEITNGYDEDDFLHISKLAIHKTNPVVRMGYFGSIFGVRATNSLCGGFKNALEKQRKISLLCCGSFDDNFLHQLEDLPADRYKVLDSVPHDEALRLMSNEIDILILILSNDFEGSVADTGKFFEYLRIGKPILALVPPGAVSELILNYGLGETALPNNPVEIGNAIVRICNRRGEYAKLPQDVLTSFARENSARRFESIMCD